MKVSIFKYAGWALTAIGGLLACWASDKEEKAELDEKFQQYILEKKGGNNNE